MYLRINAEYAHAQLRSRFRELDVIFNLAGSRSHYNQLLRVCRATLQQKPAIKTAVAELISDPAHFFVEKMAGTFAGNCTNNVEIMMYTVTGTAGCEYLWFHCLRTNIFRFEDLLSAYEFLLNYIKC